MCDNLRSFSSGLKRARKESKDTSGKKYTQYSFADEFGVSFDTVKNWEQGRNSPHVNTLVELCDFFHCDMGYLFCEYSEKHHIVADIQKETGLEPNVIQIILNMKNSFLKLSILNELLQDDCFLAIIDLLYMTDYHKEKSKELDKLEDTIKSMHDAAETPEEKEKLKKRYVEYRTEHRLHEANALANCYRIATIFSKLLDKRYDLPEINTSDLESKWKQDHIQKNNPLIF